MGIFDKFKKHNDNDIKQLDKEQEIKQKEETEPDNNVTNLHDYKKVDEEEKADISNSQEPLNESKLLEIIKDESIPIIKSEQGNVIFRRDYENKRIILENHILDALTRNNQLGECIDYLKEKDFIEYLTVFTQRNQKVFMINFHIKNQKTYLVPMIYADEINKDILSDDKIHYTQDALDLEISLGKAIEKNDNPSGREMRFCSIKNPNTNEEFLPLFKTKKELRTIFSRKKYHISEMTFKEADTFSKEFKGIVYRPTVESFIISSEMAQYFTGICEYKRPYVDYRKYTQNEKTIEDKLDKIGTLEKGSKEADLYYKGILQNIYDLENIYTSLSKDDFNKDKGISTPLALTKDKSPAIYMFSDISYGNIWAEHYSNYIQDKPLVGCINSQKDFDSVFAIAEKLGIDLCMFNEGQTTIGFSIKLFMEVNNMTSDIIMRLPKEDAEKVLQNKANEISLKFNKYSVIGMDEVSDNTEYYELKLH